VSLVSPLKSRIIVIFINYSTSILKSRAVYIYIYIYIKMFTNSEEIFLLLDYEIDLSFRALHFYI